MRHESKGTGTRKERSWKRKTNKKRRKKEEDNDKERREEINEGGVGESEGEEIVKRREK